MAPCSSGRAERAAGIAGQDEDALVEVDEVLDRKAGGMTEVASGRLRAVRIVGSSQICSLSLQHGSSFAIKLKAQADFQLCLCSAQLTGEHCALLG